MTRFHAAWLAVAVAGVTGCGAPEDASVPVTMDLAWQAPLVGCTDRTALGHMQASLLVGGHETPCALDVDATTLAVSGACPAITVGLVRPLLLTYTLADPQNSATVEPLAFLIAEVDLRPEAIDSDHVAVNLTADGTHAVLLIDATEVAALPQAGATDDGAPLFEARAWARARIAERGWSLDCDDDSDGNLAEACAASLYSDTVPSCRVP